MVVISIGSEKLSPLSVEIATVTKGSCAAVNHATATLLPSADMDGPLTGHPAIFQLSLATGFPICHLPSIWRVTKLSRNLGRKADLQGKTQMADIEKGIVYRFQRLFCGEAI